ncbi:MAG: rhomboid family intramembrane serine protease, partial [Saprospiraceae bacterium]
VVFLITVHTPFWFPGMYGIMPRTVWGIRGILTAPFIHSDLSHILSNTVPLVLLTWMLLFFYRKIGYRTFFSIYFMTGILVWIFARSVSHIGASGVVYGLVSFLFWMGVFRRSIRSIILAAIVAILYSGMFTGIFPDQPGVSWESHLLGSVAGIITAYLFKGEMEEEEIRYVRRRAIPDSGEKLPFFSPDIFEKTKAQREVEAEAERLRRELSQDKPWTGYGDWIQSWTQRDLDG